MYKYNKKTLRFERVSKWKTYGIPTILLIIFSVFFFEYGRFLCINKLSPIEKEVVLLILNEDEEEDKFSPVKLEEAIRDMNLMHPDIVLMQSRLETGHYKKPIFLENKNLFGLKEATIRATTCEGTNEGHAYYTDWRKSVFDYALYQTAYLRKLKTEDSYIDYLQAYYAEDPEYGSKLRYMLKKYRSSQLANK